jgi:signal transduction histidine kinase
MAASETLFERLRRLAVEDPRNARNVFLEAFDANSSDLPEFLDRLRKPGESRLRQVVANAVRAHPGKKRLVPELLQWRDIETDEFTRRAIAGALAGLDASALQTPKGSPPEALPREIVDAYRYVSERLRHRLRNTMLSAQAQSGRLREAAANGAAPDIQVALAKVNDALLSLGRELEATDVDPKFFQQRSVVLGDWLRQMDQRYTNRYSSVNLTLINADGPENRILASDYLLETIFWNLWLNAHQAAGSNCMVSVVFEIEGDYLLLKILDNGQGFSKDLKDIAFQQMYSTTRTPGRGRGLLEIQDAVERLGGLIRLYEENPSEYRLQIRLPLEAR